MSTNNKNQVHSNIGIVEWFKPGEYDRVEQVVKDFKELGIQHLRTGISWADWYVPGTDKWYDWLLPELQKQVEILPCFLYTPPSIGVLPKTSSLPKDLKAYADFIDVMITRYGKYFEWVELWNEPNNRIEYDFTLDYSWNKFTEMIGKAAYWAQHRGKKTLLGGMSPIDPNWLQMMYERKLINYIDAIGIHGFPDVFDQQWNGWEDQIASVREVMDCHHSTAELWITEAGFSTWQNDEVKQWKEFANAIKTDVNRVYWYSAYDLNPDHATVGGFHLDEREYHFGLKTKDGKEKLLYKLLKNEGLSQIDKHPYIKKSIPSISSKKYTLIAGGAGFIGTNLAKSLLNEGKPVMLLDNLSRPGVETNLKWLYENYKNDLLIQIADIRDERVVKESVTNADQVFNFSAQVAVTTSLNDPVHDFEVNVRGTLNLLEAIRKSGREIPMIFTSTNKVYGNLGELKFISNGTRYYPANETVRRYGIDEQQPLDFHSPYGCSKGAADQYVLDYARSFDLPTAVFRMSCIYGPHQFGNEDQGWVAHFILSILNRQPITIFGDGKQVRDILFVNDLVSAFKLAVTNIDRLKGNAFNIGGGPQNTVSLLEVIQKIRLLADRKSNISFEEWRTGDQQYYVSDIRKFSNLTGWQPQFDVNHGIKSLIDWFSKKRGLNIEKQVYKENEIPV